MLHHTKLSKRIGILLLCFCFVLSCLPVIALAETDGGEDYQEPNQDESGTYLIATASQLYWFANHVNDGSYQANAKLTADIIVNDSLLTGGELPTDTSTLQQWTPIGNSATTAYKGTFDGNGHTISGLYYRGSDEYVGLFGRIGSGATIQDVSVIDSCFQVSGEGAYLGGIVGYVDACTYAYAEPASITIAGCSSAALLISTSTAGLPYCGGVAGYVYSYGGTATIQNCMSTGDITATSTSSYGSPYCGGVIGYVYSCGGSVTIQNCFSTGTPNATSTSAYGKGYAGGVAGGAYAYAAADSQGTVTLFNCYCTAEKACGDTYTSDAGAEVTLDKVATKTADAFASGEVAYLLNGSASDDTVVWKQTLTGSEKMSVPGFSGQVVIYDATTNTYSNESLVSVTITWETMEFTYTAGDSEYNADTHKITTGAGSWSKDKKKITVTNHSNVAITADFHFTAGDGVTTTGNFYEYRYIDDMSAAYYQYVPLETDEQKIDLAAGGTSGTSGDIYFDVSGDAITADTQLGAITISISKYENVAKTEKPPAADVTVTGADTDIVY